MSVEVVPCSVISMEFFDRLWGCGIVRDSGSIIKCFDEPCGDFIVSDKLREVSRCMHVNLSHNFAVVCFI